MKEEPGNSEESHGVEPTTDALWEPALLASLEESLWMRLAAPDATSVLKLLHPPLVSTGPRMKMQLN